MIHIDEIRMYQLRMPLVRFFETSFGRTYERTIILVEVVQDGVSGWGEVTTGEHPFFNEEWTLASLGGSSRAQAKSAALALAFAVI
jgi:L-alanine-DL-glutamate epimerase-like enolase superfamily enzyme